MPHETIANMDPPDELKSAGPLPYWDSPLRPRRIGKVIFEEAPKPTGMAAQRNRAPRGGVRGNGHDAGEESLLWAQAQDDLRTISRLATRVEEIREEIMELEAKYKAKNPTKLSIAEIDAISALHREQVKLCEEMSQQINGSGDASTLSKLGLLKALVVHNEASIPEPPRRGANQREGSARERSTMDLDGSADSPAPSPIIDKPLRGKDRGVSRSSLPPKETPIKQESAEFNANPGVEVNAKGKITFAMGAEVAFRPKATAGGEEPEWIQGVVVKIIGEGKSRRYDVQDPEPDEVTKKPGQVYRTSASSMVTIPPLSQPLGDYPKGKAVLARYPDTTTFYRAEVVGMNGSMVNLRFEGEEDAQVIMEVDRRFVLDHRG